jgi:hypothetical protein
VRVWFKRWLRYLVMIAVILAVWFTLGVLTYYDYTIVDRKVGASP